MQEEKPEVTEGQSRGSWFVAAASSRTKKSPNWAHESSPGLICLPDGPHICKMIRSMRLSKHECGLSGAGNSNPPKGQAGHTVSTAGRVLGKGGDCGQRAHSVTKAQPPGSLGDGGQCRNTRLFLLESLILQRGPKPHLYKKFPKIENYFVN